MEAKKYIQEATNQELKSLEIKKLQSTLRNMEVDRVSLGPNMRFSLEQLSESFNDLKFQQAMEEKKNSQKKIDALMNQLIVVSNTQTRKHVNELQEEMKIVVEKQEFTDNALGKCADLCSYTLDHLHDLTRFLANLLQQKEFRESLDEFSLSNIKNVLEKTLEFSQNPGRFSTVDGNASLLADISSLDLLMTSARHSLANVKVDDKSMQADQLKELQKELRTAKTGADDLNRVNQVLEDEIDKLKKMLQDYQSKMMENDNVIVDLKLAKDSLNSKLQESQSKIQILTTAHCDLEQKLQEETIKKFECEKRLDTSESVAAKLEEKLEATRQDVEANWISKAEHEEKVKKLEDDIVNGEAEIAAIRMEMDSIVTNLSQMKAERDEMLAAATFDVEENKENLNIVNQLNALETSSPRPESPVGEDQGVVAVPDNASVCLLCPKYRAKIVSLKKYLEMAAERIRRSSEKEKMQTRIIQQQLSSTENFLYSARSNMEKILKNRNSTEDSN